MPSLAIDLKLFSIRLQSALKKYLLAKIKSSQKLALDSPVLPQEISRYFSSLQSNFRSWFFYNIYQKNGGNCLKGAFQFAQGLEVLPHYLSNHQKLGGKNKLERQLKEYYRKVKSEKIDSASYRAAIIGGDLISILAWERAIKAPLPAVAKINALKIANQIMEQAANEGFKNAFTQQTNQLNQNILLNLVLPWQCALAFFPTTKNQSAVFNFKQTNKKNKHFRLKPKLNMFLNKLLVDQLFLAKQIGLQEK